VPETIYIEKVRIKNFRSLKEIEVELSPDVTVLIGPNNSGKTSFLKALNLAFSGDRRQVSTDDLFIGGDGKGTGSQEILIDIKIVPKTEDKKFDQWVPYFAEAITTNSDGEYFAFRAQISFSEQLMEGEIRRFRINDWEAEGIGEEKVYLELDNIFYYFMDARRDLMEEMNSRTSNFGRLAGKFSEEYDPEIRAEIEKGLEAINQKAVKESKVLSHLKVSLEELNRTVQSKGKGVEITHLPSRIRDLNKGMKVHFQDGGSDTFSLEYHGMGTRSWASLLAFKARISWETSQSDGDPIFPILALEEPEAHLHPNAQRMVYNQLKSIEGQKIVSTHSPFLAGQCEPWDLRVFQKETDSIKILKLTSSDFNGDEQRKIRREVILSKGELLFSKAIILYEGETEHQSFPIFFQRFFGISDFEKGVCMVKVDGNNYKPYLLLAESLGINWFVFSDYDKTNIRTGVDNALKAIAFDQKLFLNKVVKLESSIETAIVGLGYQQEIKKGINDWYLDHNSIGIDIRQIEAGQKKVNNLTDSELISRLQEDDSKVRFPSYWANEIVKRQGLDSVPEPLIRIFNQIK